MNAALEVKTVTERLLRAALRTAVVNRATTCLGPVGFDPHAYGRWPAQGLRFVADQCTNYSL